jgi:hypothetical protein
MEGVPRAGLESTGDENFGSLLTKLARSSDSFEFEDEPLEKTITLSATLRDRDPNTTIKP